MPHRYSPTAPPHCPSFPAFVMESIPSIIENPYTWEPAIMVFKNVLLPAFTTPMHLWILTFIKKSMLKKHGGKRGKKSSASVIPSTQISGKPTSQNSQSVVSTGKSSGASAANTSVAGEADETRGVAKP